MTVDGQRAVLRSLMAELNGKRRPNAPRRGLRLTVRTFARLNHA